MNYNTVYVGMDVHKESFTLCSNCVVLLASELTLHYLYL